MKQILIPAIVAVVVGLGAFSGGFVVGQKAERSQYVHETDLPEASGCPDGIYVYYRWEDRVDLDAKYTWIRKEDAHNFCNFAAYERDKASGEYRPGY